jgi:hypothetical protein
MKTTKTLSQHLALFLSAALLTAVFVTLSASPSLARDRGHRDHGSSYDRGGSHGSYGRHGSRQRRHVGSRRSHRFGHRRHFNGYNYLAGVLSGYAVHHLFHPYSYPRRYYSRSVYVTEPRVTVVERPAAIVRTSSGTTRSSCLQEREYQTTVLVGGSEVEAYGAACLQQDGSWLRGPVKLVPEFQ